MKRFLLKKIKNIFPFQNISQSHIYISLAMNNLMPLKVPLHSCNANQGHLVLSMKVKLCKEKKNL